MLKLRQIIEGKKKKPRSHKVTRDLIQNFPRLIKINNFVNKHRQYARLNCPL